MASQPTDLYAMSRPIAVRRLNWIRRQLRRAHSLSLRDWQTLAVSTLLLPVLDTAARVVRPARLLAWSTRVRSHRRPVSPGELERTVRLVRFAADHHAWHMRCLARSLTLGRILAARGVPVDVRIGVRCNGRELEAHAWVELAGTPINDARAVHDEYAAFESRAWGDIRV